MPDQADTSETASAIDTSQATGPLIAIGASITRSSVSVIAAVEPTHRRRYCVRPGVRVSDAAPATTISDRDSRAKTVKCEIAETTHPVNRLVNGSAMPPVRRSLTNAAIA